ncbi:MAG: carboxypeptidase-like regulatory domain-containing protein [Candidatus Limnocylindria bacterium]
MTLLRLRRTGAALARLAPFLLVACVVPQSTAPTPQPTATPRSQLTLRILVTGLTDLDTSGPPLPGARVCAATPRGDERCTESANDGSVTFTLAPSTYLVRVEGPDPTRWMADKRVVDVTGADTALWIGLPVRVRISGVVRSDTGAAVARAEACAHPITRVDVVCVRSGADGKYTIEARGDMYRVDVAGPPGAKLVPQWAPGSYSEDDADIVDARTNDVPDVDFELGPGVVLRGTVRVDGAAIEDAQVCLRTLAAPVGWQCERTDKRGVYEALRVPGDYWIWALPPDRVRATGLWYDRVLEGFEATPFDLSADATLNMSLPTGPQVQGRVRNESGEAVPDVFVCVDTAFTTGRICRPSGFDGSYAVTTRPSTYIINVVPPAGSGYIAEYRDRKRNWVEADAVRLGTSDTQVDLVLRRGVIVRGTIKDKRGVPAVGATINFGDPRDVEHAGATDGMGAFEVAVVPGKYHVDVFPPRFPGNLVGREMEIDASGAVEIDIVLDDVAP